MKTVGLEVRVVLATTCLVGQALCPQTARSGQRGTLQHPAAGTSGPVPPLLVSLLPVTAACVILCPSLPVSPPPVAAACATDERQRSEAPVPTWAAMTPAELRAAPWAP